MNRERERRLAGAVATPLCVGLERWNKGRGGFLHRLSTAAPLPTNCNED